MANVRKKDPWVRWFDVTNPVRHSGGFTVYKVTSKVFPVHSPEATTEIVVWKRYKDFLKLYKALFALHKNLHRPGVFPDFPKPTVFKRFDDTVIEERRAASLDLLNFVGSQPHLFNSLAVQEFFASSETVVFEEDAKPNTEEILQPERVATQSPDRELRDSPEPASEGSTEFPEELSGVWEHRRSDTDESDGEEQQVVLTVSPQTTTNNLAVLDSEEELIRRLEELEVIEDLSARSDKVATEEVEDPVDNSTSPELTSTIAELQDKIMSEFDPISSPQDQTDGLSRVSNSELLSFGAQTASSSPRTDITAAGRNDSSDNTEVTGPSQSVMHSLTNLGEYVKSKDDYLYRAVKQIRRAIRSEQDEQYQLAFDYYKRAIALLLTGVQGDSDESRRNVVRRKTAEYLVYAEELHQKYLDSSGADGDRWKEQQVPRTVSRLRAGISELSNYKVLGLLGNNMIVLDKNSEQTAVIKVLQKNLDPSESTYTTPVVPTKCSRMVKLLRYFESESTVYLILEHCQGGTLWQYVHSYLHDDSLQCNPGLTELGTDLNIYSGQKYESSSSIRPPEHSTDHLKSDETGLKCPDVQCSKEYTAMILGMDSDPIDLPKTGADNSNNQPQNESDAVFQTATAESERDGLSDTNCSTDVVTEAKPSITRRMSLRRSNSSMNRSVSVERASDSLLSNNRYRNWSAAFSELELQQSTGKTRSHLPENCVRRWAAELLLAIEELHQHGLILKHLSSENLLLDDSGHIKLTYFCQWPGVMSEISLSKLERQYVAPEVMQPDGGRVASDYYSFGVILYELLCSTSLCTMHPEGITSHTILRTPEHLSDEAKHLLQQILKSNWMERLGGSAGVEEIKSHPFFADTNWSEV